MTQLADERILDAIDADNACRQIAAWLAEGEPAYESVMFAISRLESCKSMDSADFRFGLALRHFLKSNAKTFLRWVLLDGRASTWLFQTSVAAIGQDADQELCERLARALGASNRANHITACIDVLSTNNLRPFQEWEIESIVAGVERWKATDLGVRLVKYFCHSRGLRHMAVLEQFCNSSEDAIRNLALAWKSACLFSGMGILVYSEELFDGSWGGLKIGDVIVSIDSHPVHDIAELRSRLGAGNSERRAFVVWRLERFESITVIPSAEVPCTGFQNWP